MIIQAATHWPLSLGNMAALGQASPRTREPQWPEGNRPAELRGWGFGRGLAETLCESWTSLADLGPGA